MASKYSFVVNTSNTCFLCLKPSTNNFSLKNMCQFLGINLKEIISVPERLLPILDKSDIQSCLCESCAVLNGNVSKLWMEMEVVRLKLNYLMGTVNEKLETCDENLVEEYGKRLMTDSKAKLHSVIVEKLRKEVNLKCTEVKMRNTPFVKIRRIKRVPSPSPPPPPRHPSSNCSSSASVPALIEEIKIEDDDDEMEDSGSPSIPDPPQEGEESPLHNKRHKCDMCESSFAWETSLRTHKERHHFSNELEDNTKEYYPCKICGTKFSTKSGVGIHISKQHRDKIGPRTIFRCDLCGKTFLKKYNLQEHHLSKHMGVKLKCDNCQKEFTLKSSLYLHQKYICGKEKPRGRQATLLGWNEIIYEPVDEDPSIPHLEANITDPDERQGWRDPLELTPPPPELNCYKDVE